MSRRVLEAVILTALLIGPLTTRLAAEAGDAGTRSREASVSDGAAITPAFADALYKRLGPLRESDGCRVVRFDTSRFRITIGLQARSGAEHIMELATATERGVGRRAGGWALAVPAELERDCAVTLATIERELSGTAAPLGAPGGDLSGLQPSYAPLAASFVLLVLGTVRILYREVKAQRPSPYAVVALCVVWGAALALRLSLSPRTFLHEFYHVAETVSGYLTGNGTPVYGNTGPALFRLVAGMLGRPQDVQVIFVTNAVLASLAIPAVALLDLTLLHSWPQALCAAVLLCVLPQHLRFSAAEDLFVQAVTFGMWALGLCVLYLRTRRLDDALCAVLALSLAMQARPEMLFFPAALVALVLLAEPCAWRALLAWRTLLALSVLAMLLLPRFFDLHKALHDAPSPVPVFPELHRYVARLVLFQGQVTPAIYWVLLAVGLAWGVRRKPGVHAWVVLVFVGYTLFSLSIFDNPPYNLRSQILPTSFVVLIAAGVAPVWMALWGRYRRLALGIGACTLVGLGAAVVVTRKGFVTELRDQQLEWAFLERTVPRLPERATLLSAVEIGGRNLDAFPELLLQRASKAYQMVDVRLAAKGDVPWPTANEDLLYYQGMFCYFAFSPEEPSPDPMTAPCRAVHEHYVAEPLFIEDLKTQGYSALRYAGDGHGPFRIGFFRLKAPR
jgi:hypothetical protein